MGQGNGSRAYATARVRVRVQWCGIRHAAWDLILWLGVGVCAGVYVGRLVWGISAGNRRVRRVGMTSGRALPAYCALL
jgi:hypothetical protein